MTDIIKTSLNYLKEERSIRIYSGMSIVSKRTKKELKLNNYMMKLNELNGHYSIASYRYDPYETYDPYGTNTIYDIYGGWLITSFVSDNEMYVTPVTMTIFRLFSRANFHRDFFKVPFEDGDYPKKENPKWKYLLKQAFEQNLRDTDPRTGIKSITIYNFVDMCYALK